MSLTTAAVAGRSAAAGRRRATDLAVGGTLIVLAVVIAILALNTNQPPAPDFHYAYFPAAHRLLSGISPYAMPHQAIAEGIAYVYPALSAVVLAPFALLSRGTADDLYMLICFLLVPATLWALNVRDWRVYGLPLLWAPVVLGWEGGNVSLPLGFLVALAWRYRDRPLVAGLITAVAISLKPFVWPLWLWLLVTRRWRAAAFAVLGGAVVNLLAWATVGFDQIHVYVSLSSAVVDALWRGGYSLLAVAHQLGLGRGAGEVLLVLVSGGLVVGLGWVGLARGRDRQALILAVALMLVASPLVWSHYFVLLIVPLALALPTAGLIWLLPCVMWICPPSTAATGGEVAVAWLVAGSCVVAALRAEPDARRSADPRPPAVSTLDLATGV